MAEGEWYYCLEHHVVEPYQGCKAATRLGPYPTAIDAANALERVAHRNEEWENDPRFSDEDSEAPDDESEGWVPFRS